MEKISFSFGKNWKEFIDTHYSEDRVRRSQEHILNFLGVSSMKGQSFLDIGCGSGLSSAAALKSGASNIVSFDLDPIAVEATKKVWEISGKPKNWTVLQGSVLDDKFLSMLEPADINYSWGVLHHTGKIWEAIEKASRLTKVGGQFYISIYLTTPEVDYWRKVKKLYNESSDEEKRMLECWQFVDKVYLPCRLQGKDPYETVIKNYVGRGMEYFTDLKDWLGGYPFETATVDEVIKFCTEKLGFSFKKNAMISNPEYLFARIK